MPGDKIYHLFFINTKGAWGIQGICILVPLSETTLPSPGRQTPGAQPAVGSGMGGSAVEGWCQGHVWHQHPLLWASLV